MHLKQIFLGCNSFNQIIHTIGFLLVGDSEKAEPWSQERTTA